MNLTDKSGRPLIVISAFDKTGEMVRPWAEAGFLCYCLDIQHEPGETRVGNIIFVGVSVYDWVLPTHGTVAAFFAFPPCTHLAVSGSRWFAQKEIDNPGTRRDAMALVYWSRDTAARLNVPGFAENPVSVIASEWRRPDYTFQPWQYSALCTEDSYEKLTCLWTFNGFRMPRPQVHSNVTKAMIMYAQRVGRKRVGQYRLLRESFTTQQATFLDEWLPDTRIHLCPPGPERANFRSATPKGFAIAVFNANATACIQHLMHNVDIPPVMAIVPAA